MVVSRKHSEGGLWINEGNENYTKLGGQTKPLEVIWGWGGIHQKVFFIFAFFLLMETFGCFQAERKGLVKQER